MDIYYCAKGEQLTIARKAVVLYQYCTQMRGVITSQVRPQTKARHTQQTKRNPRNTL